MPYHANFCLDPLRLVVGIEDGVINMATATIDVDGFQRTVPAIIAHYEADTFALLRTVSAALKDHKQDPLLHVWGAGKYCNVAVDYRIERPKISFLESIVREDPKQILHSYTWQAFVCVGAHKVREKDADTLLGMIAKAGLCVIYARSATDRPADRVFAVNPKDGKTLAFVVRVVDRRKPRMYD